MLILKVSAQTVAKLFTPGRYRMEEGSESSEQSSETPALVGVFFDKETNVVTYLFDDGKATTETVCASYRNDD